MDTHGYFTGMEYEVYQVYPAMGPAHMRFLLTVKGVATPEFDGDFSYCELGCGQGYGLLMQAAFYPKGRFVGVDFSASQIERAKWLAREMDFDNVEFRAQSFEDVAAEPGDELFDVIALHGVWSWVGRPAQIHILEIIAKRLKPGGVVYVSANIMQGWSQVAPFQRLLIDMRHAQPDAPPEEIFKVFKAVLESNPNIVKESPRALAVFEKALKQSASYMAHEYFNEAWQPVYFSDLAADMAAAGLEFGGPGSARDLNEAYRVGPKYHALVSIFEDRATRESVKDFILGESFRKDYFVKQPGEMTVAEQFSKLVSTTIGLTNPANRGVHRITGLVEVVNLDTELRDAILAHLGHGVSTLGEVLGLEIAKARGLATTLDTLYMLLTINVVDIGCGEIEDPEVRERARRFNSVVLLFSRDLNIEIQVAAPHLRAPMALSMKDRAYLLAMVEGRDPVQEILGVADRTNANVTADGKVVTSKAARLAAAKGDYKAWFAERMPQLASLGIVGFADEGAPAAKKPRARKRA